MQFRLCHCERGSSDLMSCLSERVDSTPEHWGGGRGGEVIMRARVNTLACNKRLTSLLEPRHEAV